MDRGWYVRFFVLLGTVTLGWLVLWPSLNTWIPAPEWVRSTFQNQIVPGLDIRGGLRMTYEVDVDDAIGERREARIEQLETTLCRRLGICEGTTPMTEEQRTRLRARVTIERARNDVRRLAARFEQSADVARLDYPTVRTIGAGDLEQVGNASGNRIVLQLTEASIESLQNDSVEQARETIQNRIDEFGVGERSVMIQQRNIIIELPGRSEADFARIRDIISRTARLEFKVVDDLNDFVATLTDVPTGIEKLQEQGAGGEGRGSVVTSYLVARGEGARERLVAYIQTLEQRDAIPSDHQLAIGDVPQDPEDPESQAGFRTYWLEARAGVTGDSVADARVQYDQQTGNPEVGIEFDSGGARAFEELTGSHIQRRMAIVLDDRVASAPVIQTRIGGGQARITMGGGLRSYNELQNESQELVVVLRAGALPAPIRALNEQRRGPTLGREAVTQGAIGAAVGIGLVLLFMALYYRVGGLIANVMVIFNVVFLMAILASVRGSFSLSGIAGIALTVGMAVDANVLINERIREELRLGKSPRSAVEQGFDRAFWSIFDGQLTTAIAGVVIWQYGGPDLRGFATTLLIGIVTSLFTGVFCSKVAFDWVVNGLKVRRLHVG